jgi:Amidohydrolase
MADPKKAKARVQKSDAGTGNTLDTTPTLPIIDGHCHIFGHSLYEGGDSIDALADKNPYVGISGSSVSKGTRRFLAYTISRDFDNGKKVIDGVPHEKGINATSDNKYAVTTVPLLLDMGYTPLDLSVPGAALPQAQARITEQEQIARTNNARPEPDMSGKRVLTLASIYCKEMEDYTGDDDIRIEVYNGTTLLKMLPSFVVDMNGVTRMINEDIVFDADATNIRIKVYEEDSTDSDDLLGIRVVALGDAAADQWKKLQFGNSASLRKAGIASSQASSGTHYELTYKVSKKPEKDDSSASKANCSKNILTIEHIVCKDQEDWSGSDSIRIVTTPAPKETIPDISASAGQTSSVNKQIVFKDKVTIQLLEVDNEGNDDLGQVEIDSTPVTRGVKTIKYNATFGDAEYDIVYTVEPGEEAESDDEYYESGESFLWFRRDKKVYEGTISMLSRVAARYPAQIWPLVPFDPRRPDGLDYVKRAVEEQGFIGVKLYSRCGWMPLHNRELYGDTIGSKLDARLDKFYDYLIKNDLPVLNHTSPTGFPPDGQIAYPRGYINARDPGPTKSYEKPGMPPIWLRVASGGDYYLDRLKQAIQEAAVVFGKYCHYVQKTTSPYAWSPVLDGQSGKLRLCFAHSGSHVAMYHRYKKTIDDAIKADLDLADAFEESELFETSIPENPFVFPGSEFRAMFETKLLKECKGSRKGKDREGNLIYFSDEETAGEIESYIDSTAWKQWFDDWEKAYPDSWIDKIIKYESSHDNVYSDISYISGDSEPVFQKLVEVIVSDAGFGKGAGGGPDGKIMGEKHFVGTDWYMTEVSEMGPEDFWNRVKKGFSQSIKAHQNKDAPWTAHPVFKNWVTNNCLMWLNIEPRLKGNGFKVLDDFYKENNRPPDEKKAVVPPVWWKNIESFYKSGG